MSMLPTAAAFTFGGVSVDIPQSRLPGLLWQNLGFVALLDHEGYEEIAKNEVLRIQQWLRRIPASPPWNILRVAPNMERRVRDTLAEAGLQVYVPVETRWPKGYRLMTKAEKLRAKPITRPLVPGLVFAVLPDDDAINLVNENKAARLLKAGDGPLKVRAQDIGVLAFWEACHEFDETWAPPLRRNGSKRGRRKKDHNARWKGGERVKVTHGPFAGLFGEVLRASREDRVEVLMTIFGRETPAEVEEGWLEELAA